VLKTLAPSLKFKPHRVVLEVAPDIAMDSYPGPLGQVIINPDQQRLFARLRGKGGWGGHHMLEPFFSTKIGSGGTGLGMSIVKNLVTKLLGGRLAVLSTPGSGTTVDIILARHAPDTAD
jgi:C4-dicarboxylate-specific signal transduction histidine kinase